MMPLGMVEIGESGVIGKITGQDEVRQHLAELGFVMEALRAKKQKKAAAAAP